MSKAIGTWLDAVVPAMNGDLGEAMALAEPEPDVSGGYDEETITDPVTGAEIHGQDGFRWYVDAVGAKDVVRRLNYDVDTGGPRAKAWDRGGRPKVALGPPGPNALYRELLNARRSDFVALGFLVMEEDAVPSPGM